MEEFQFPTADRKIGSDPEAVGEGELLQAIGRLTTDLERVDAFAWLIGRFSNKTVQRGLLRILEGADDPTALAEMADHLERVPVIPRDFGRAAWETFRRHFEARSEHPWMRSQALRGALIVAQGDAGLVRRLQAYLLDVETDDDGEYLKHVAKVAGVILRKYPADDFRELLSRIADVEAAADEAALEIGLDRLQEGLLAKTHDALKSALTSAHQWFQRSIAKSERRPDAVLYEACTGLLLEVQERGLHADLALALPSLRKAAIEYSAFAYDSHGSGSWLGTSSRERFHWLSMANRLALVANRVTKDVWLQAAVVIEDELLSIFFAAEKIFGRADGHGMDLLGRDALVQGLRTRRYHLQTLNQWLDENAFSDQSVNVERLRDAVQNALTQSVHRGPFDASTGRRLVDLLMESGVDGATASMSVAQLGVAIDRNDQVSDLWSRLMSRLEECPDYQRPKARLLLEHMCLLILRFLDHRANVGRSTDPASEYLFRDATRLPVEHDLQLDFLKFLAASDAPSFVAERRDIGSGRADISLEFRGVRTIVEVKKDDNVSDNRALATRYAGQATGYLTTGVRFGFLLVLDLTDRKGHQPHITEQISVETKVPEGSSVAYQIVVARVQGRRKTPSSLV